MEKFSLNDLNNCNKYSISIFCKLTLNNRNVSCQALIRWIKNIFFIFQRAIIIKIYSLCQVLYENRSLFRVQRMCCWRKDENSFQFQWMQFLHGLRRGNHSGNEFVGLHSFHFGSQCNESIEKKYFQFKKICFKKNDVNLKKNQH